MEPLLRDKEAKDLERQYKEKFGKRPPIGFNFDEYTEIEEYKKDLRKLLKESD